MSLDRNVKTTMITHTHTHHTTFAVTLRARDLQYSVLTLWNQFTQTIDVCIYETWPHVNLTSNGLHLNMASFNQWFFLLTKLSRLLQDQLRWRQQKDRLNRKVFNCCRNNSTDDVETTLRSSVVGHTISRSWQLQPERLSYRQLTVWKWAP